MKTINKVIREQGQYQDLINAVIEDIGEDSIQDVNNNGMSGGYGSFVYYKDTCAFYQKHKKDIIKMAQEMAEQLGEDMLTMIAGFNCLKDHKLTATEIGEALWQDDGEMKDQIQNAMAWFAAEEVCRMFDN